MTEEGEAFANLTALMRRLVLAGRSSFGHGVRVRDHARASCDMCNAVVQAEIFLREADEFEAKQAVVAETVRDPAIDAACIAAAEQAAKYG